MTILSAHLSRIPLERTVGIMVSEWDTIRSLEQIQTIYPGAEFSKIMHYGFVKRFHGRWAVVSVEYDNDDCYFKETLLPQEAVRRSGASAQDWILIRYGEKDNKRFIVTDLIVYRDPSSSDIPDHTRKQKPF